MLDRAFLRTAAAVAVLVGFAALAPRPARACGGFFCNAGSPVNQAAERILFSVNGDGTVTAVVQVLYEGPSEQFAWMLPVPGAPEVEVSSDLAFQRLQSATNPSYQLTTEVEGQCRDDFRVLTSPDLDLLGGGADASISADGGAPQPPVAVVDQGNVGPYDYVTISLDPALEDPGDAAVEWLQTNGYDVDDMGRERLGPYLADGLNLIAFRLTKDRSAGAIRPIFLTYEDDEPMIPIRPTAVAAEDDMGVMVWVLAQGRAVPVNYLSLELNEALINWFNPASNYDEVVTAAANEAGGQGFVTELADDTSSLGGTLVSSSTSSRWSSIRSGSWTDRHWELVEETSRMFLGWDGYRDVIERHVLPPDGVSSDEFFACLSCYVETTGTIEGFDVAAFLADLDAEVYEPMDRTQQLLREHPYVTRLYTTMSAHEMTMDPIFGINTVLEDVSNVHTATRVIECAPHLWRNEAPWRVELESGDVVRGEGSTWPVDGVSSSLPYNRRVLQLERTGMGSVVTDNTGAISAALADHNGTVPGPPEVGGGGCAVGSPHPAAGTVPALLLWGATLLGLRRRRRR